MPKNRTRPSGGRAPHRLKKVVAWLHRHPLTADLLVVVGLVMVVIAEALRS